MFRSVVDVLIGTPDEYMSLRQSQITSNSRNLRHQSSAHRSATTCGAAAVTALLPSTSHCQEACRNACFEYFCRFCDLHLPSPHLLRALCLGDQTTHYRHAFSSFMSMTLSWFLSNSLQFSSISLNCSGEMPRISSCSICATFRIVGNATGGLEWRHLYLKHLLLLVEERLVLTPLNIEVLRR